MNEPSRSGQSQARGRTGNSHRRGLLRHEVRKYFLRTVCSIASALVQSPPARRPRLYEPRAAWLARCLDRISASERLDIPERRFHVYTQRYFMPGGEIAVRMPARIRFGARRTTRHCNVDRNHVGDSADDWRSSRRTLHRCIRNRRSRRRAWDPAWPRMYAAMRLPCDATLDP